MKSIMKKVFCFMCIATLMVTAVACGNKNNVKEEKAEKAEAGYSQELAKYFPNVEGTVLNYSGTAEYAHSLTLNKVTEEKERMTLNFKGEIQDMSDGESKKDLILETEYVIDRDSVKEIQKNETRKFSQSIIREQVVLKLPIEIGTNWDQKVSIDGKEYTAETKIVDVSTDEQNKNTVTTETIVKGIDFYTEDTYKEVKTFKEGKGLINYDAPMLLKSPDSQEAPSVFDFQYSYFEM